MALLKAQGVTKRFGGLLANDSVDLAVEEGQIVGLIGPNGAGKTTFFNCLSGHLVPDAGTIIFNGRDITRWPAHRVAQAGIARTFQLVKSMGGLTVEENVMIGAFARVDDREEARRKARQVLELVGLLDVADMYPGELPLAVQKQLELARALATEPKLLMLDEVAAGLSPEEIEGFAGLLRKIHREKGLAMLVIEHVMEFVLPLSERVYVLAGGRKIAEGTPDEITNHPAVIEAYLGEGYARAHKR